MTDMAGLRAFAWELLYTCIAAIVLRSNVKLAAAQRITRAVVHDALSVRCVTLCWNRLCMRSDGHGVRIQR